MAEKYSEKNELLKANEKLQGDLALLGMSALTWPGYNNSMRTVMYTSHLKQFVVLRHSQFPGLFTNAENVVGEHNSTFKRVKHDTTVYRKVVKYGSIIDNPTVYNLFLFDEKKKRFWVATREECEDLVEVFGYNYNNEYMDTLEEGDSIPKGQVLYKSESYDDSMNYCFGRNIPMMYTTDSYTHEDACVIAESLQEEMASTEVVTIEMGVNTNEYLLNKYGDDFEYKAFPNIGEYATGEVIAKRPMVTNQLLRDFEDRQLQKTMDSDEEKFRKGEVVDINIYCNNPNLEDKPFNTQLLRYLDAQTEYWTEIKQVCEDIMNSGYKYSHDIEYLLRRANDILNVDDNSKWVDDSTYGSYKIEIKVRTKCKAEVGQKFTGRFGNKSVVSTVRKDEDMPYYYDDHGNKVVIKLLFNILAIVNRTTAYPLYELSINFICNKVRQKMMDMTTRLEKEELLFGIIRDFNEVQEEKMHRVYSMLPEEEKDEYIQNCIEERIFIHEPPMWETKPIFYRLLDIYQKYDFLQPYDIYIKKWGREIKTLRPAYVGEMYIIKLKQTSRKGFSVRSTGSINGKELPERSYKNKHHSELKSSTPIRFGEYETFNFAIAMIPEDIQLFHLMYRTSVKGRRELAEHLLEDESVLNISDTYTSRTAEIFSVILKSLGLEIEFVDEEEEIKEYDDDIIRQHYYKGRDYMCTDFQFMLACRRRDIEDEILEEKVAIDGDELNKLVYERLREKKYVIGPPEDEFEITPGLQPDTAYDYEDLYY